MTDKIFVSDDHIRINKMRLQNTQTITFAACSNHPFKMSSYVWDNLTVISQILN